MYIDVNNPYCKIQFATENGNLEIFQLAKNKTSDNLDFDVLSLETTRDIGADDCATFSISLAYKQEWYESIHSCDLVIIELGRGKDKGTVLYGMVDNTFKSMAYIDLEPKRVINITGRGFNKAFMQFDIGAVQEINGAFNMVGFFKGQDLVIGKNSPSKLIQTTIDFYLDKGIDLKFANGKSFKDYFNAIYLENSRQKEESIGNPYNSFEFQGSLWAYLKELRNAPFNELFWEIVDNKPTLISRPTPFNPRDWTSLPLIKVEEREIIDEQLGRSDLETYTLYAVKGESLITDFDQMFGAPIWYEPYYKRYGLRRLQVTSKYKSGPNMGATGESDFGGDWKVAGHNKNEYEIEKEKLKKFFNEYDEAKIESQDKIAKLLTYDKIRELTGYEGVDIEEINGVEREKAAAILKEQAKAEIEAANSQDTSSVSQKTIDLFNWNIKNNQMENGNLILKGDTRYQVGSRLYIKSSGMEYYIENVNHSFVYAEGWQTTLQLTRGLKYGTRFTKPWNQWKMIEIQDLMDLSGLDYSNIPADYMQTDGGSFVPIQYSDPTGFRSKIGAIAKSHAGETYDMGKLRMNEGYSDCSSFVYKVTMEAQGRQWRGTWAPATYTMIADGERLKLWYKIPLSQVQPWDILLRDGHTEFLGDDGRTYGAHTYGVPSGPSKWKYDPSRWTVGLRIYGL